jgi:hypothetical protein
MIRRLVAILLIALPLPRLFAADVKALIGVIRSLRRS